MKKVIQTTTYQCDSCLGPQVHNTKIPSGWKELKISISTGVRPTSMKNWIMCKTCCETGNAQAATLLSTLLK